MKKMVKLVLLTLSMALIGCGTNATTVNPNTGEKVVDTSKEGIQLQAKIETTRGPINLELYPEDAPMTVLNFVVLSEMGYYDGLKFHRVIEDFMIQGGDPEGTGRGGPGYNFGDEFHNGHNFSRSGMLAMANAGPNTNGSQFFITHAPTEWLNNKHTIFGMVIDSNDQKVVDMVEQGDVMDKVTISGEVEDFLAANVEQAEEIRKMIRKNFPNLKK